MSFPGVMGMWYCPIEGCIWGTVMRSALRVHFLHCHVRDTMVILEEVNLPHTGCLCCDMLVPWEALNGCHTTTTQCAKGAKREELTWRCLLAE